MIVQCRQCRTKFRFDDAQMLEDGVWMRCSRCQHVFFQDNPLKKKVEEETQDTTARAPARESMTEGINKKLSKDIKGAPGRDEDIVRFLDHVMDAKKTLAEDIKLDTGNTGGKFSDVNDTEASDDGESDVEEGEGDTQIANKGKSSSRGLGKIWRVALWSVFVVIAIPALIYFVVFPQLGDRLIMVVNKYTGGPQQAKTEVVTGYVKLQDIRQRIINNYILGHIRIVEGTAVNQADFPISRIVVKGEIVDAYAVVLGERVTYAGNVLTDDELTNLPEEEIFKKLAQTEGRNHSNDRIIPNGQIPFMIVFAREPAGVIKTTVMTIGAEKLL